MPEQKHFKTEVNPYYTTNPYEGMNPLGFLPYIPEMSPTQQASLEVINQRLIDLEKKIDAIIKISVTDGYIKYNGIFITPKEITNG